MQRGDQNTGERGKQHERHDARFEERDIVGRTRDRNRETLGKAAIAFADETHRNRFRARVRANVKFETSF